MTHTYTRDTQPYTITHASFVAISSEPWLAIASYLFESQEMMGARFSYGQMQLQAPTRGISCECAESEMIRMSRQVRPGDEVCRWRLHLVLR